MNNDNIIEVYVPEIPKGGKPSSKNNWEILIELPLVLRL